MGARSVLTGLILAEAQLTDARAAFSAANEVPRPVAELQPFTNRRSSAERAVEAAKAAVRAFEEAQNSRIGPSGYPAMTAKEVLREEMQMATCDDSDWRTRMDTHKDAVWALGREAERENEGCIAAAISTAVCFLDIRAHPHKVDPRAYLLGPDGPGSRLGSGISIPPYIQFLDRAAQWGEVKRQMRKD
jgi:hypothetical protein